MKKVTIKREQSDFRTSDFTELMPEELSLAIEVTPTVSAQHPATRKFHRIEDWESYVEMKRELIELKAHRLSLQSLVDESTKGLKEEFEKRERIEREVAKLERLNLIGQLAASLGHEIRNPMTTIRGFLQLLQHKADLVNYKSYFDLMIEELDRTNSIIHEFLSLTKNKPLELKRQNLNEVLHNLFPLLQSDAFSQGKQISFQLGEIMDLDIASNEITQLVLNLARNGLEAMPKDACLTISTYLEGMEGEITVLSIQDEGSGINPEHLSKLGTPFFTTKENGTGLGLLMCYRIAEWHNAKIELKTGAEGSVFLVRFPTPKNK